MKKASRIILAIVLVTSIAQSANAEFELESLNSMPGITSACGLFLSIVIFIALRYKTATAAKNSVTNQKTLDLEQRLALKSRSKSSTSDTNLTKNNQTKTQPVDAWGIPTSPRTQQFLAKVHHRFDSNCTACKLDGTHMNPCKTELLCCKNFIHAQCLADMCPEPGNDWICSVCNNKMPQD